MVSRRHRERESIDDSNDETDSKGSEEEEKLGRGRRVVRKVITCEEEMMLEKQAREIAKQERRERVRSSLETHEQNNKSIVNNHKSSKKRRRNHYEVDSSSTSSSEDHRECKRPLREGALKALELLRQREEEDDEVRRYLASPSARLGVHGSDNEGKNHNSSNANSHTPIKRNVSPNNDEDSHLKLNSDVDDIETGSSDTGDGFISGSVERQMETALANKKKTLNSHLKTYLESGLRIRRGTGSAAEASNNPKISDRTNSGGSGGNDADNTADIVPLEVDTSINFEQVGGLPQHILALREMVLIPLLYPKLLSTLHISPPRGVLFVGPPGTGKTLLARALASEGTRIGEGAKITFFLRKGADVLSKWLGESERQLRLLFDEARRRQPSIIFFDEIDGLAPVRHSKQEQSHAALVSTLLALMDGLTDRGRVIVIGATNRPDTIDPALRRPGRFDRELRFPLPDAAARRQILDIHMSRQTVASSEVREAIVEDVIAETAGWSGADLASVSTEAALHALRRSVPQIYVSTQRLKVNRVDVSVTRDDYRFALRRVGPTMLRAAGGGAETMHVLPTIASMLHTETTTVMTSLVDTWAPAADALEKAATENVVLKGASQMRQLVFTLSNQLGLPLPSVAQGRLLFLSGDVNNSDNNRSPNLTIMMDALFRCTEVAKLVINRLPSLCNRVVHLPNLGRHNNSEQTNGVTNESGGNRDLFNTNDTPYTVADLFASLHRITPCVLLLLGLEEWLSSAADSDINFFLYNLTTLLSSDVLVLSPVTDYQNTVLPLLHRTESNNNNIIMASLNTRSQVLVVPEPSRGAKLGLLTEIYHVYCQTRRCVGEHLTRLLDLLTPTTYQVQTDTLISSEQKKEEVQEHRSEMPWPELPVDTSPLKLRNTVEDKALRRERWEYVAYKRRQLHSMLRKWVSTFLRKYLVLLSGDLDFTPDHELWNRWQKHVKGRKIGLNDIMIKIENGEYPALSIYNSDVEQLCDNVRTFFAVQDQRYRPKAMELRESTLMNMYRIHRNLIVVCEENKEMVEPGSDDREEMSDDEDVVNVAQKRVDKMNRLTTSPKPKSKKRRRDWTSGRRRRRRPQPKQTQQQPQQNTDVESKTAHTEEKDDDGDEEKSENTSDDEEKKCSDSEIKNENGNSGVIVTSETTQLEVSGEMPQEHNNGTQTQVSQTHTLLPPPSLQPASQPSQNMTTPSSILASADQTITSTESTGKTGLPREGTPSLPPPSSLLCGPSSVALCHSSSSSTIRDTEWEHIVGKFADESARFLASLYASAVSCSHSYSQTLVAELTKAASNSTHGQALAIPEMPSFAQFFERAVAEVLTQ